MKGLMRSVAQGDRLASLGVLLGLVAVGALLLSVVLLWWQEHERAEATIRSLREQCQADVRQDQTARGDLRARIIQLDKLIAADEQLRQVAPEVSIFDMRLEAYRGARAAAVVRLDSIEIADCTRLYG